jgi:regulation of enolase protein 1 (concanavalin A-like superfamily)
MLLIASAVLIAATVVALARDEPMRVLFEDRFPESLAKGWMWVREDDRAWKVGKDALIIQTSTGGIWTADRTAKNLLVRTLPEKHEAPMAIEVTLESEPTGQYEHAGLVLYFDDDNYVTLVKEVINGKSLVQLVSEKESKPVMPFPQEWYSASAISLRMVLADGKVTGHFRASDLDAWRKLGECKLPATGSPRVGLITGYGPKDARHEVKFQNFRITGG